jgi:lysophospholipase L1-like esterase
MSVPVSGKAVLAAAIMAAAVPASAQTVLRPPANGRGIGDYTLHDFAAKWMMQQDDLAEIERYREANAALITSTDQRPRVVLMGDSITDHWDALEAEPHKDLLIVNRGIGGQNTSQMLLRFEDDVAALKPAVVVILGGTNDLRAYVGDPASVGGSALARISRNITAMSDIAQGRGFKVVLATLPPVGADREKVSRDAEAIKTVNAWIKAFAAERGYPVADYHAALVDAGGVLPPALSPDGIHPNAEGYAVMRPVLAKALAAVGQPLSR